MREFKLEYKNDSLVTVNSSAKDRSVRIPVWIRDMARPDNGSPITFQDLHDSDADMWVLGSEMAQSGPYDMQYGAADTHNNEWLCCGPVPIAYVGRVMPFDGEKLHLKKGHEVVMSTKSSEEYVFDWDQRMWRHNPDTSDFRPFSLIDIGDKRKDSNRDESQEDAEKCDSPQPKRARLRLSLT
jgi:hypothetical protein